MTFSCFAHLKEHLEVARGAGVAGSAEERGKNDEKSKGRAKKMR